MLGILGRQQSFSALFAHLLQDLVQPFGVQTGDIGGVGVCALAGLQYLCKAFQYIIHGVGSLAAVVDGRGIFEHRLYAFPAAIFQCSVKAAAPAGMTGNTTFLLNFQQDYIRVAIEPDVPDNLLMSRAFALTPQFTPGAGPVYRLPLANGQSQ